MTMRVLVLYAILCFTAIMRLEACKHCTDCDNTHHHWYGRSQRSVGVTTVEQEFKLLENFESLLNERLGETIEKLSPKDKEDYFESAKTLHSTIRKLFEELAARDGNGRDTFLSPHEIMVKVIQYLHATYENEEWFQKFRKIGGTTLEEFVQNYLNEIHQ